MSGLSTQQQSSQVHSPQIHQHAEPNIHTHPPGQPPIPLPPHVAPGMGEFYHHHSHGPPMPHRVRSGPSIGATGYPHKVMPDSLPAMAYHPPYHMPMSHGKFNNNFKNVLAKGMLNSYTWPTATYIIISVSIKYAYTYPRYYNLLSLVIRIFTYYQHFLPASSRSSLNLLTFIFFC